MERYLINNVKRRNFCSYGYSQIRLYHPSPLLYAKAKTPAPEKSDGPIPILPDTKKRASYVDEITRFIEAIKKQFDFSKEMASFGATQKLIFRGNIVIESNRSRACAAGIEMSESNVDPQNQYFFADGCLIMNPKRKPGPSTLKPVSAFPSGAAVVYKALAPKGDEFWKERFFAPASSGRDSTHTEYASIACGLIIAAIEMQLAKAQNTTSPKGTTTTYRVTIFNDSMSALQQLDKLQESTVPNAKLLSNPNVRKIIIVSQYLHSIGVQLELRWVPGHSNVEGNWRANAAARYAANHPEMGILLEEALRWEIEASSNEMETHVPQQKMPRERND